MQGVETTERPLTDLKAAEEDELSFIPKVGSRTADAVTDRYRPQRQLVPGKQVAGEAQEECQKKKDNPYDPVEFTRGLVGASVEHPHHVQEDQYYHPVSTPAMKVSHQEPKLHVRLKGCDILIGSIHGRNIVKHKQNTRGREQKEHEEGQTSQAVSMSYLYVGAMNARGVKVEEDVRSHYQHLVSRRVRVAGAEDRPPYVVVEKPIVYSILEDLYSFLPIARFARVLGDRHLVLLPTVPTTCRGRPI